MMRFLRQTRRIRPQLGVVTLAGSVAVSLAASLTASLAVSLTPSPAVSLTPSPARASLVDPSAGRRANHPSTVLGQPAAGPALTIPAGVAAAAGGRAVVPVGFAAGGAGVASVVFSIDYDPRHLSIDPTDADGNGNPDAVAVAAPGGFTASVMLDTADEDGELDIMIADLLPPLARLPDGPIVRIAFDVAADVEAGTLPIAFSRHPEPSFGGTAGTGIPGTYSGGSIQIGAGPASRLSLPRLFNQGQAQAGGIRIR